MYRKIETEVNSRLKEALTSVHYETLLSEGGDERSDILENNKHKYHLNPAEFRGLFTRGSCTCNSLNDQTGEKLNEFGQYIEQHDFESVRKTQANRLKNLLNYKGKDAFDVVFAPSGSDLAYLPLIFSDILDPGKEKLVLLTCPEELGSGSQMGFLGKYFGNKNQFGQYVEKGEDINPYHNISLARYSARSDDGLIIDHTHDIKKEITMHPDMSKIGALVIGSKSGIEDDITLIPKIADDVMWVVDLCQFRNSKKLVNHLLGMGCMVMITGSKFYQAPPFCGVMLVPKKMSRALEQAPVERNNVKGYDTIFSYYDFPEQWTNIRKFFPKIKNYGLTLRWEIAIDEMERFNEIPRGSVNEILRTWNKYVNKYIAKSKYFELMPHQDKTNSSIISFKVKDGKGGYLEYDDLRKFFKFVVLQEHDKIEGYQRVFFGQPVRYGYGAFIRLALGANNIYNLYHFDEKTRFDNDRRMVELLDEMVGDFLVSC